MKKRSIYFLLITIGLLYTISGFSVDTADTVHEDPRTMTFAPVKFDIPKVERIELENGMVLFLLEDHVLPKVHFQAVIKTGQIYEPAEKAGLAAFTGVVLREGGAGEMSSEEINRKLEYMAASISVDITRENGAAGMFVLNQYIDEALPIYADILRRPAFEQEKIDKRINELAETFRRENDEPDDIVGRKFREMIYKNHPYSRRIIGYADTVEKIKRKDLVAFHRKYFRPNNIMLGVSGDFNRDEMVEKIEKLFGDWKKKETKFPQLPQIEYEFEKELYFIEKEITQSNFFLCHLGVDRLSPDYFKINVMNYILGASGFNSRLMNSVRTASGLAYSVGSYFHFPKFAGFFLCYCQTKTGRTSEAIQKIIEELELVRNTPVSREEYIRAKEALKNKFIFRFQTSAQILQQMIFVEYQGLPKDYLETYLDNIGSVTLEDIQQTARKYIHPDKLTLVLVGNKAVLETFPVGFGKFNIIELKKQTGQKK
jgi:zinc protease